MDESVACVSSHVFLSITAGRGRRPVSGCAIVEGLDSRVNTVSPQRCPVQVGKKALEYRLILLGMISISFRETKRRIIVKNYARQHAAVVKAPPTITLVVSI